MYICYERICNFTLLGHLCISSFHTYSNLYLLSRASLDDVSKILIMASFMKGSARLIRNNKVAIVDRCFYNLYRRSMLDLQDYLKLFCDTCMTFVALNLFTSMLFAFLYR